MSWIAEKVISPLRYSPMSRPESAINRVRHDSLGDLLNTYIDDSPLPSNDHHRHVIDINSGGGGGPQRQFVLSFTDLTYSVPTKSGTNKTLLNSITGNAREGEILAVLGASGSGKSTLIDALAHRIKKQSLKGTITLNGQQVQEKLLKSISAYVMQDDLMFPMLTVEETLMFSAEFRLPRTLSKSKKFARVQTLIDQLGLRAAAKTVIGDEGHRGVSGGERRRVSIGTDIIHDPIVLFLDEPTSGLDSTSAFMVVQVLQRIAHSGSVVIMSIHQPSYRILGLLDRLIILTRGQTVYNGAPTGLPLYLSEFQNPIPENENPIEFALDLIRELEPSESDIAKLVQFSKEWRNMTTPSSSTYVTSVPLKDAIATSINRGKLVAGGTTFANPLWAEIFILAKRSITNSRRMPEQILVRLGAVLVTGFILATIFWRLDHSPKGATERLGFLAFAMSTVYYTCAEALPVFLQERYIFMRETAYNTYRRSSYVLSNAAVGFPSLILLAFAFTVVTFFAVGLAGGIGGCVFFFLAVLASFWAGSSFVTFLSGMIPDVMMGYTVVVAILAYFLLFSGFFINRDRIPGYWIWFHYLSLVKYPYEAVLQNEFEGSSTCFARGLQIFDDTLLERLPVEIKRKALDAVSRALGARIDENTCVTNGAGILRQVGVGAISKWDRLLVTVAFGFLFRVLFYFTLLLGSKNKRR